MELLDRYLQAIEFWLPKRQRQDIITELSEDLRSQVEEKETELGRKLEDAEVEAILKRCGSPLEVASRYRPQQYLIGPTLFPIYRFVLAGLLVRGVGPRVFIWPFFPLGASAPSSLPPIAKTLGSGLSFFLLSAPSPSDSRTNGVDL